VWQVVQYITIRSTIQRREGKEEEKKGVGFFPPSKLNQETWARHSITTMAETPTREAQGEARIAVIGAGWWAQGWHLPHLAANAPSVKIAAIVDANSNPVSTLASSPLLSLEELSQKYGCPHYKSMDDLLSDPEVGPTIDGAIVATSHASHYAVGTALLREGIHRRKMAEGIEKEEEGVNKKPRHAQVLHRNMSILMEKPMTTSVDEAKKLWEMSSINYPEGEFVTSYLFIDVSWNLMHLLIHICRSICNQPYS
jgi:hypothetical protein